MSMRGAPSCSSTSSGEQRELTSGEGCAGESPLASDEERSSGDEDDVDIKIGPSRRIPVLSLSYLRGIPRTAEGNLVLSYGSQNHPNGCLPCIWHVRRTGCYDGVLCGMCHANHSQGYAMRRRLQRLINAPTVARESGAAATSSLLPPAPAPASNPPELHAEAAAAALATSSLAGVGAGQATLAELAKQPPPACDVPVPTSLLFGPSIIVGRLSL